VVGGGREVGRTPTVGKARPESSQLVERETVSNKVAARPYDHCRSDLLTVIQLSNAEKRGKNRFWWEKRECYLEPSRPTPPLIVAFG
jgi:hypothetical protein